MAAKWFKFLSVLLAMLPVALCGCEQRRTLAPVHGRVLLGGKPLRFGGVSFQSTAGQPSQATIAADGSFDLVTRGEGHGAVVGPNRVLITCYESQDPSRQSGSGSESKIGRSLIPDKYTSYETSGLTVDVLPDRNDPVVLELTN